MERKRDKGIGSASASRAGKGNHALVGDARTLVTMRRLADVTGVCAMIDQMGGKRRTVEALSPEAVELVAARFRVLGEPVRIRILQTLQEGEKNVTELVAAVGSTQPNVSKHLKLLQDAGIVGRRQSGNNVYCYIADDSVMDLCDAVCGSVRQHLASTARLAAELGKGIGRR
jgi:DNA-binding transcriptional ArsR family regulator